MPQSDNNRFGVNTGGISGQVIDGESGEILPFVNIAIKGTILGTATDEDGYFKIENIPVGTHMLISSYIGYRATNTSNIEVLEGSINEITISMLPSFLISDAVIITASRKAQTVVMAPASIGLVTEKQLT